MSLDSVLARARRHQADQFTDRAAVLRPLGDAVFDHDRGTSSYPTTTLYVDRPCKVKTGSMVGYDVQVGETEARLIGREVEFEVGTEVAENDLIVITDSVYNVTDIGQQYRVTDIDRRTWQACRRVFVQEVSVAVTWEDES